MKLSGAVRFFRSPAMRAVCACLCIALGFFFGSAATRRHTGEAVVVVRSGGPVRAAETAEALNINTADEALLQTLPGIGPKLAQEIVAYREEHGPFQNLYELMDVKGIGSRKYEALLGQITIE
ncbi:MAG: helix-hairpin-helix domain-containing protein [Oscillospiraceae bacterium]|nr:helix-hairpin-helix domain-containing protein [Oscillospiraceae bacterium]